MAKITFEVVLEDLTNDELDNASKLLEAAVGSRFSNYDIEETSREEDEVDE